MAEIENPWHSRPLDVHRWSDYPEVKSLVDKIWDEYVEETVPEKGRGPKPKMADMGGERTLAASSTNDRCAD